MKRKGYSDERLEELLRKIPEKHNAEPSQEAIEKTIFRAREIIEKEGKMNCLNFAEFILLQLQIMQKRWWIFQIILLIFAGEWISISGNEGYTHRGLSIIAALFIIAIIPELWKNKENRSFEIEESSLFNLRRVYAAKLIGFGVVDTVLLTSFCIMMMQLQNILFADILKQFVFPIMIAATICLMAFSHKRKFNELVTMLVCMTANILWMIVVVNEAVYYGITPWIWSCLFAVCMCLIIYYIYKAIYRSENSECSEVEANGFNFG